MINTVISKVFGTSNERAIKRLRPLVDQINALEPAVQTLSDEELRAKTAEFRQRIADSIAAANVSLLLRSFPSVSKINAFRPACFRITSSAAKKTAS